jgi:alkanesulfonate monooxygenase SsuD/methylene tetrahydromethanopterin reductase-like flavin-dependent oxidoreductase (luciferase family)
MDVGVALPTMAPDYTRATTLEWCRGIDAGPFSSVSAGERITFRNQEMMVTNAAAAALTERVRVFVNLVVLPFHPVPLVAKQLATLDVLSGGRLTVGVGVGGREHDYRAAGSGFERRHARLDADVAELRRIWAGRPPFEGADPVGPHPVQPGGPELLAGAMGPRAMARAARWADGVSGFSLTADGAEMAAAVDLANRAWSDAGRDRPPRTVSGCFAVLGTADDRGVLQAFTYDYLAIFGTGPARAMAAEAPVWNRARLRRVLDDAEAAGVDEFVLVPGTTDPACLAAFAEVVGTR